VRGAVPEVGVVVVTRNRKRSLLRTLAHLRALPERPPIVVVDNGSEDGTAAAVGDDVTLVRLDGNHGAAARTAGVRVLETEAIAFSDDDSWWAPGSLARGAEELAAHPALGLIAARILVGPESRLDPTCLAMANSPLPPVPGLPGPAVLGFLACGAIVRRRAYLGVGGFHRHMGVGAEESLLALDLAAAGWELAYVEDIVAHHHPWRAGSGGRERRSIVLRNLFWAAWLRRPAPRALALTAALTLACVREGLPRALLDAVRGLPWVLHERRVLPPEVERAARLLSWS
jgi:GT2 family glycosyltransferase